MTFWHELKCFSLINLINNIVHAVKIQNVYICIYIERLDKLPTQFEINQQIWVGGYWTC